MINVSVFSRKPILVMIALLLVQWNITVSHASNDTNIEYFCVPVRSNVVLIFINENILENASYTLDEWSSVITNQGEITNILSDLLNEAQLSMVCDQNKDISFYAPNPYTLENVEMGTWLSARHVGAWWCYAYAYGVITPPYIETIRVRHFKSFQLCADELTFVVDKAARIQHPVQKDYSIVFDTPVFTSSNNGHHYALYPVTDELYLLEISGITSEEQGVLYLDDHLIDHVDRIEKAPGDYCTFCLLSEREAASILYGTHLSVK